MAALAAWPGHGRTQEAAAPAFADSVRRDTEWIAGFEDRTVGAAGHGQVLSRVLQRASDLPGVRVWTQGFRILMPITHRSELRIEEGESRGTHRVYPMWPCLVRLNNTPASGIAGQTHYLGTATPPELPARSLRGQIGVVEMHAGARWRNPFSLGAAATILLGSEQEQQRHAHTHLSDGPIYFPRFYLPDGDLADAFRAGRIGRAVLQAHASWDAVQATNVYALVKPAATAEPRPALGIMVPLDAVSAMQGLAPGADAAVDLALALNLLEHFARRPPQRPLLFLFVDAYGINMVGTRMMLHALSSTPADREFIEMRDRKLVGEYAEHLQLTEELERDSARLHHLYQARYKPLHRYVKDAFSLELNYLEKVVPEVRLIVHLAEGDDERALASRLRVLETIMPDLVLDSYDAAAVEAHDLAAVLDRLSSRQNRLKSLQNQLILKTPLREEYIEDADKVWRQLRDRVRQQVVDVKRPLARYEEMDRLREEIADALRLPGADRLPLEFILGIDLSDSGPACGPSMHCHHLQVNEQAKRNSTDFTRWLQGVRDGRHPPIWPESLMPRVNLAPLRPRESLLSFVNARVPTLTSPAPSFGQKAATWATLDGRRTKVDTGLDRPERLDWEALHPQIEVVRLLVERMARGSDFQAPDRGPPPRWCRAWGYIVDRSPGDPVPRAPMPGFVTALVREGRQRFIGEYNTCGIRYSEFDRTGIDGRFRFEAVPANGGTTSKARAPGLKVEAFKLSRDGRILRAVSGAKQISGLNRSISLSSRNPGAARAMVFDCVEVTYPPQLFDVRKLAHLQQVTLFDSLRRRSPEMSNARADRGELYALVPPETRWQLLAREGKAGVREVLLDVVDPEAENSEDIRRDTLGFEPRQPLPRLPEHQAALDFWRINERRLRGFRRAGITSRTIEKIHERTKSLLDEAAAAVAADDGEGLFRHASAALANEMRAYRGVRRTADDVVRGVMFLLLGLLPFSVAMERLIFGSPHIYKQITGTAGVFLAMCVALWSFHPAFRITNQPLMLVLAFVIIFLSTLVIGILLRRFQSDIDKARSGRAESSGASTARGGLLSCALTIGIATMRKRKLRTALTGTTIALITFALLSFSSTSRVSEHSRYRISDRSANPGVLVEKPNKDVLHIQSLELVRSTAGTNVLCVPRFWLTHAGEGDGALWRLHVTALRSGRDVMLKAGLVLDPSEGEYSGLSELLPDWEDFLSGPGCYLPQNLARELGIEPGDRLRIAGATYTFTGGFDPAVFDDRVKSLTGDPLSPLDYDSVDNQARFALYELEFEDAAETMLGGGGMALDQLMPPVPAHEMAVLPRTDLNVGPRAARLRSIAVQTPSSEEAEAVAVKLAGRLDYPVYFSSGDGVEVLAATALIPQPPRSVLIPLLVAGLIVFNTMLNSIAERRKEIHIYTSLGLAPVHVAGIFMAEALTYGMIGGIFGYVVGQGLATLFSHLGWFGNLVLNYSGTQVMYTMSMVILVVLISALVPASMAARLASPSKETGWRLSEPEGDVIRDILPFTVTPQAAGGVLAFLWDYLDAHRDGSIGHFTSQDIRYVPPEPGSHLGGVEAVVWVEPYDLGVRQHVAIRARPPQEDVSEITIALTRQAGQVKDWRKLNRVFVSGLRNQMLGWRNVGRDRVLDYLRRSRELAGDSGGRSR